MKNLKQFYNSMVLLSLFTLSCKQVTNTVDETFHPNDSLVQKYKEKNQPGINETNSRTTTITTSSSARHQEKTVVVNGITINTADMQGKAKAMFDDIELLKKQKIRADSREIQQRVNEFLNEMKLDQLAATNSNMEKPAVKAKKGMLSTAELEVAEEKLIALPSYRNKEIMVYQTVHFYDNGTINLMLQHPVNPKYVDAYEYRDEAWSAPKPVLARDVERRTFPLSKMNFKDARKVLKIYNDNAAQIEGAKPGTSVYISIWDENMRWNPRTISGTRERYDIQFNNDGTLKSFRLE